MESLDDILDGLVLAPLTNEEKVHNHPVMLPFRDASTKWKRGSSNRISQILEEDLKGVAFKRMPLPIPDFETYRSIPSYTYQVVNRRDTEVKIIVQFNSSNLKIDCGSNFVLIDRILEGYLKPGVSAHLCNVEPADKKAKTFDPIDIDITVHPAQGITKEEALEEVKLYTRVDYGPETTIEFDVYNGKTFEVIAEVDVKGEILKRSGSIPFESSVRPGERVRLGFVTSKKDVSSSWKWRTSPATLTSPPPEKKVTKSEAKGVFLTQYQTPAELNHLEFEIENTLPINIVVEIDIKGTGQVDTNGEPRPLKKFVRAKSKVSAGSIRFKGDIGVAWSWKEDV